MNIAIFSPNQNPYSETFIQAHKNYLIGNIFYYYGYGESIKLEYHPPLTSPFKYLSLKLYSKLLNKPQGFVFKTLVLKSLKEHEIDIILIEYGTHAHDLLPLIKVLSIPVVVHFHGYDASCKAYVANQSYYADLFRLASKFIVVSKVMEKTMLSIGCPKDKLVYNVYGPRPEFKDVQPTFSKKQFVAIGRFTDKKAPYYTILAFKDVLSKHPDAQLLMAGDGVLLNSCKNIVKHFGIETNVQFLGVINTSEFKQLLSESLAFVQHSITAENGDMEGTPLAVLEASSSGLPVISTIHSGIPDVIFHEDTGLLCKEHDVIMMTKHMLSLLDDVSLAQRLGTNGKMTIDEHFSMSKHIQNIQRIFTDIASC